MLIRPAVAADAEAVAAVHVASWQDAGYTFVIAGIMTPAEAEAVAERARTQLRT